MARPVSCEGAKKWGLGWHMLCSNGGKTENPMKKLFILLVLCAAFAWEFASAAPPSEIQGACPIGEDYDCGGDVVVR